MSIIHVKLSADMVAELSVAFLVQHHVESCVISLFLRFELWYKILYGKQGFHIILY